MNIFIVYAHPEPSSLNGFLKDLAVETLTKLNHHVKVSDLYEMNFKSVADRDDFKSLHKPDRLNYLMEQFHASQNRAYSQDIMDEQAKITWADLIIFQYPIWWTDAPAMLKGWFDRVFTYHFAYGPGSYDKGNLKGKKAMLSITHGGANLNNYGEYGLKGKLYERLFNIQHEKLYFCGMDVMEPFVFPAGANEMTRKEYINKYKNMLADIDHLPIIPFHPTSHFEKGQLLAQFK